MKLFYDLHIHSCLSPCGDDDMTPNNIVNMAYIKGLDVIAVTDHNSGKNVEAVMSCAQALDLLVLPGMEVQTKEEVHVLCYFPELCGLKVFEDAIEAYRMKLPNNVKKFGHQTVMNAKDEVLEEYPYALIISLDIGLEKLITLVEGLGGILVPAHINKGSNSLLKHLGFIPETLKGKTIEIFQMAEVNPNAIIGSRVIYNSDAHYLDQISEPVNHMKVEERSLNAVFEYLKGKSSV